MNRTNGNKSGCPEKALVPYPAVLTTTKGDPNVIKIVLQHFSDYIAHLPMRKLYSEHGNVYFGVSHDTRGWLQTELMMAIPAFKVGE